MRQLASEAELIALARQGDGDAYVTLLRLHQAVAFRTAYLIVGSAEEAEDATQEAFVKTFRALDRFEVGRPFRPWLLHIVANEARNHRRSTWRRGTLASRAAVEAAFEGSARSAEADVLAAEDRAHLLEAIDRLPDGDRMAIVGRYILELSDEEAAAVLGIKPRRSGSDEAGACAQRHDRDGRRGPEAGSFKVLFAPDGTLYLISGDPSGGQIKRLGEDGALEVVVGTGALGAGQDGMRAKEIGILPSDIEFAQDGALLFSQSQPEPAVRRVDPETGVVTTILR